jgi:hypothetical protein
LCTGKSLIRGGTRNPAAAIEQLLLPFMLFLDREPESAVGMGRLAAGGGDRLLQVAAAVGHAVQDQAAKAVQAPL